MGLCWSCFRTKRRRSLKVPPANTNKEDDADEEDDLHPAVVIEMASFRKGTESKKKAKSTKIARMQSLQSTVIREHDSTIHSGANVTRKPPRRRHSGQSTGRLSPVKLKTQRNVNPNSIRIRTTNETTDASSKTASDTALANFQKLKLQVQVAKKHKLRQQKVQELEEEAQETSKYNSLWNQLEDIQQKTAAVEYDLKDANVAKPKSKSKPSRFAHSGGASVRSFLSQRSRKSRNSSSKTESSGFRSSKSARSTRRKKKKRQSENGTPRTRSESFDLKETETWYFDFDGLSPAARSKDGSTCGKSQANLSLLSESSMAVQRRLYEEKRRQRKQRKSRQGSSSLAPSNCQSETSSQREDYGPARMRRRPSQESLDFSFTDMEVVASPLNNSCLSDLDNDSLSYLSLSSQDFQPTEDVVYDHKAVVQQRLDIEAQLRALQASDDEEDPEENVLSVRPLTSGEIDAMLETEDEADDKALVSISNIARGVDAPEREAVSACEKTTAPEKTVGGEPCLQRFIPTVQISPIKKLPDSPARSSNSATHRRLELDSPPRQFTAPSVLKLSPANSPARSVVIESIVAISPPSSPLMSQEGNIPMRSADTENESDHHEDGAILVVSEANLDCCSDAKKEDQNCEEEPNVPDDKAPSSPDDVESNSAAVERVSDKAPIEPILNLKESRARLTQRLESASKISAAESAARLKERLSEAAKTSPLKPAPSNKLEQGINLSPSREPSSSLADAERQPLDESIASEEETQAFQVPYNLQSPTFGLLVPMAGSQSDSLVVNQSVDDSVDHQSVEGKDSRTLAQPRVLLSSLQSPTSVLDARETLEIAGKVEAHVHDVLHRYRSEDLYRN